MSASGQHHRSDQTDGLCLDEKSPAVSGFVTVGTLLGALLLVTFLAQLPGGASPRWLGSQHAYSILWPQGWFFYSQVSRHEVVVVYSVSNDGRLKLHTQPQAGPGRLWGVKHSGSAELVETEDIYGRIPKKYWASCAHLAVQTCWTSTRGHEYQLASHDGGANLCGRALFVVEAPTQWHAKHDASDPNPIIHRIAAVKLACGH